MGGKILILGLAIVIVVGLYVGYSLSTQPAEPKVITPPVVEDEPIVIEEDVIEEPIDEPEEPIDEPEPVVNVPKVWNNTIILLSAEGCTSCAAAETFLEGLRDKYNLELESYEDQERVMVACEEYGIDCGDVPITLIGETVFMDFKGYSGELAYQDGEKAYIGYRNQIENDIRKRLDLGRVEEPPNAWREGLDVRIETDKKSYYERDPIMITVTVETGYTLEKNYVKVEGIDSYIHQSEWVSRLEPGENVVTFWGSAPNCFGCANFQPGEYEIRAWLEREQKEIDGDSITVEIRGQ